ncbi:MAG: hypothetical protein ACRCZ9_08625, partial [Fusobacteriaceae bacterium]
MLKIATIFSGIGAIEQAAIRLGIDHKIVFACDNGGVNIYKKSRIFYPGEIDEKLLELEKNLKYLINFDEDFSKKLKIEFDLLKEKINERYREFSKLNFSYDFESLLNHLKEIQPKKYNKIMYLDNNIDKISFLLALKKDLIPS